MLRFERLIEAPPADVWVWGLDFNQFVATPGAVDDADRAPRHAQNFRQQVEQCRVRRPRDRRRLHVHLDNVTVDTDDAVVRGTRPDLNLQPQACPHPTHERQ